MTRDRPPPGGTPTGCLGAILGSLAGGAWGCIEHEREVARAVAEGRFVDFLPALPVAFALLGAPVGLLAGALVAAVRRWLWDSAQDRLP
jgi:hypothetical protein